MERLRAADTEAANSLRLGRASVMNMFWFPSWSCASELPPQPMHEMNLAISLDDVAKKTMTKV